MITRPLFATINTILFPTTSSMFIIKRDFSLGSLKESLSKFNGELVVTSQKKMSVEKPWMTGIFPVGCLCQVTNHIELPDGTIKFNVQAKSRFKIYELSETGNVILCSGESLAAPESTNLIAQSRREKLLAKLKSSNLELEEEDIDFLSSLKADLSDEHFVMGAAHILKYLAIKHRELTFDEMNRGVMLLDALTEAEKDKVNIGMAEMYRILESNNWETSMQKMENY